MLQRVESLLVGLGEARLTEPLVSSWIVLSERYCKENNLIWHQEFPADHPIQELERLLTAVLIKHQSLGPLVLAVLDRELSGLCSNKPPNPVIDIIKLVYQTKWALIRTRQQLNRSYKEVCAPMLERCRFLLYEVRPAISVEQNGLKRLNILYKSPRFKTYVQRIINEMKNKKTVKADDLLNVTIQTQVLKKNLSNENLTKSENFELLETSVTIIENKNVSNENLVEIVGSVDCNVFSEKKTSDDIKTPTNDLNDFFKKQKILEAEQFINDVISKLSEKCLIEAEGCNNSGVMNQIVEFVMQETCDVETLRRAMYCQVQRYQIRKQGLDMFSELLTITGLLDAVEYNLLNGYLGLFLDKTKLHFLGNVLDDLNMIAAFQKADIILSYSKIINWAIAELQRYVNQEQVYGKQKHHGGKDNSNLGTYVFLKKLPRARFLISVFGILAKDLGPNELSLLINSGTLGCILGLLRQTGGDVASTKVGTELSVLYEDTILRVSSL